MTTGTPLNITMSGLINPEPYQKAAYESINTIEMTYYDAYHPVSYFLYNQPPYTYFIRYTSMVFLTTTYISDIRTQVPTDSQSIVRMTITCTDTQSELTRKLDNRFEIVFNSADISQVEECWVENVAVPVPYRLNAWCQTTGDKRVLLYNFYESNVVSNLALYVRLRHIAANVRAVSNLYSSNMELQYTDPYTYTTQISSKLNLATANHLLLAFT